MNETFSNSGDNVLESSHDQTQDTYVDFPGIGIYYEEILNVRSQG